MTETPASGLVGKFLNEPNIAERVKIARAAVNGLPPDDAVSVLFAALNVAVDQFRAVLEIAVTNSNLNGDFIMDELRRKLEQRSSDYLEYQFMRIVDPLDDGTATS